MVASSLIEFILSDLGVNMVGFRALRLLRPLLAIKFFEGIKAIMRGLSQNFDSMSEAFKVLCFFYLLFAVSGVQLFGGLLKGRCVTESGLISFPETVCQNSASCGNGMQCNLGWGNMQDGLVSFDDSAQAFVLLFQVVSLSDWYEYLYGCTQAYESRLPALYFLLAIIMISITINNLFVAIVCFGFAKAEPPLTSTPPHPS